MHIYKCIHVCIYRRTGAALPLVIKQVRHVRARNTINSQRHASAERSSYTDISLVVRWSIVINNYALKHAQRIIKLCVIYWNPRVCRPTFSSFANFFFSWLSPPAYVYVPGVSPLLFSNSVIIVARGPRLLTSLIFLSLANTPFTTKIAAFDTLLRAIRGTQWELN